MPGQKVDVTGITIGRGFTGAMKRWNFRGLEATPRRVDLAPLAGRHRRPSGSGQDLQEQEDARPLRRRTTSPPRIFEVAKVDVERGLIMVRGAVPGTKGGWVMVRDAVKHARHKDAPMPASVKKREKNGSGRPRKPAERRRRAETMKTKVLNLDNKAAGEIDLNDAIFGLEPRADLIQRVVVWQLAKRRAGTHKMLTRGEVNRTTKKVYKQKGTGQARHGARSAPLFVGGGKAMGPVLRSHEFDLPKKVRALGLRHALSAKAKDAKIIVVLDEAKAKEIKTDALAKQLGKLDVDECARRRRRVRQEFRAVRAQSAPRLAAAGCGPQCL